MNAKQGILMFIIAGVAFYQTRYRNQTFFTSFAYFFSGYLRRAHVRIIPRWRLSMREEGDGITARILDVLAPLS